MKRMLITAEQLKAINEAAIATYDTPNLGSALNTFSTSVPQKNAPALVNVQSGQDNPNAKSLTVKTNNGQVDPDALAGQSDGNVKDITFSPMSESRYTKRQVELGRMLEMRRTGKVYSKKQLNEMFFDEEKISSLIGSCSLMDIFSAANILSYDGEERLKDAYMSGADLNAVLDELYAGADEEAQEEFKEELGI